jgi:hypothetical protein
MTKRCLFAGLAVLGILTSTAYADGGQVGHEPPSGSRAERPGYGEGGDSGHHGSGKPVSSVSLGQASQEEAIEATAHYARARNLLITALNEFDKGRKIASPNELLDPVRWRNTLIDRAEDLDRVLDPQPRATKGGIKFEADPRLLPEAHK